jgi:hypothetical protein
MSLRDSLRRYVPVWLSDRYSDKVAVGFGILWTFARVVDVTVVQVLEGAYAAAGKNLTALKYVGEARGIVRGRLDTDETYQAKLATWIDRWKTAGSQLRLATELAEYIGDARVRIVNRHGHWVTVDPDGTVTEHDAPFDWDSVSHPERASFWSEMFVIVYSPWAERPGDLGDLAGEDGFALGHMVPRESVDVVKQLVQRWKSAHTLVRAVIWTTDPTAFDPTDIESMMPDGRWGAWSMPDGDGGTSRVPSGRDLTSCRYWEPR